MPAVCASTVAGVRVSSDVAKGEERAPRRRLSEDALPMSARTLRVSLGPLCKLRY